MLFLFLPAALAGWYAPAECGSGYPPLEEWLTEDGEVVRDLLLMPSQLTAGGVDLIIASARLCARWASVSPPLRFCGAPIAGLRGGEYFEAGEPAALGLAPAICVLSPPTSGAPAASAAPALTGTAAPAATASPAATGSSTTAATGSASAAQAATGAASGSGAAGASAAASGSGAEPGNAPVVYGSVVLALLARGAVRTRSGYTGVRRE